jgi:hypothetical protein
MCGTTPKLAKTLDHAWHNSQTKTKQNQKNLTKWCVIELKILTGSGQSDLPVPLVDVRGADS